MNSQSGILSYNSGVAWKYPLMCRPGNVCHRYRSHASIWVRLPGRSVKQNTERSTVVMSPVFLGLRSDASPGLSGTSLHHTAVGSGDVTSCGEMSRVLDAHCFATLSPVFCVMRIGERRAESGERRAERSRPGPGRSRRNVSELNRTYGAPH